MNTSKNIREKIKEKNLTQEEKEGLLKELIGDDLKIQDIKTTLNQFNERVEDLLSEAKDIREEKNPSYSGEDDYHGNFKKLARLKNVRPISVAFNQYWKHFSSLLSYVKDDSVPQAEPLEERFADLINYTLIMYSLYKEEVKYNNKIKKEDNE